MTPTPIPADVDDRPLVVACLRFTDPRPEVDPLSGAVERDVRDAGFSPADLAALEHALRVAHAWSGRVLAVCAGPPAAEPALRELAALGVHVLRIDRPGGTTHGGATHGGATHGGGRSHGHAEPLGSTHDYLRDLVSDEQALASVLAAAIRSVGEPVLVLCGDRSPDRGTGALPALLAHVLGAAQALGLVELRVDGQTLTALRRLDGGRRERLRLPRPTVCSVEAAGVRLRRAALPALLAANQTTIPVTAPAVAAGTAAVDLGPARPFRPRPRVLPPPSGNPRDRLMKLTGAMVAHDPPTVIGPVEAPEAADALLAYLRRNDYLTAAEPSE